MTVNDDLRMELADCGSPERLLAVIMAHHEDWTAPIPLEAFCASMGISAIQPLESDGFEGALVTDENKAFGAILYNGRSNRPRQRFTIGHELGHFLIPSHRGNQSCTSGDMSERGNGSQRARQEAEANRFSAGLLMPQRLFRRALMRSRELSIATVTDLASKFETSFEATANRCVELGDECCAFVYVKNGVLRYTKRSKDFPAFALRRGDPVPNSFIPSRSGAKDIPWAECDAADFLAVEETRQSSVSWQAKSFSNGNTVVLLTIEPPEADDDHDVDIDESWTPQFRR